MWCWCKRNDQAIEAGFWVAQTPVAFYFGWVNSTVYLSLISIYALVKGSMAAHHAKKGRNGD